MTISNTLNSTALPATATKPATRPSANPLSTMQPNQPATQTQPSLPSGLVGHNVNTTA
jgi:hypothetical protein